MSPVTALTQLLSAIQKNPENTGSDNNNNLSPESTLAVSLSRLGSESQSILFGTLSELAALPEDRFGAPLHSLVIVGKRLHPLELAFAEQYAVGDQWKVVAEKVYGLELEGHGS